MRPGDSITWIGGRIQSDVQAHGDCYLCCIGQAALGEVMRISAEFGFAIDCRPQIGTIKVVVRVYAR